jgi:uncharacterized repeat protein (TIGR03806 family)
MFQSRSKSFLSKFKLRICFEFRISIFELPAYFLLTLFLLCSASSVRADNKLTGTIIGTAGSWNNSGNTKEKAMDGNLSTFFDGPDPGTGEWVGLDFGPGVSNTISQVRYCPRGGWSARMVGGKFQGANVADFSVAIDLFTLPAAPAEAVMTTQGVTVTNAFRYVRYLGPDPSWCNVAEIEFYAPGPAAPPPVFGVYRELWTNLNFSAGNTLGPLTNTALNPNWPNNPAPGYSKIYTNLETESNTGLNNYGQRVRAFIVPPTNGAYTFWIASDDSSQLFLSSDENPSNVTAVAWVSAWTNPREWTKESNQKSGAIALEAGRRYYLEAIMQQGGGGDDLAVRWQLPGGSFEEPLNSVAPAGTRLIPCTGVNAIPGIFVQPTNTSVAEHGSARFSLLVTNQASVTYQWLRNGTNPVGFPSTKSFFDVTNAAMANNGQNYRCVISNISGSVTSAPAILAVIPDTVAPTLVSAVNSGLSNVLVRYSEPIEPASATNKANYSIGSGIVVSGASFSDPQTVRLSVSPLTLNSNYTVTVNNVRDLAGTPNTIAPNSQISFTVQAYGLEIHPSIGAFLNNQMPEAAPPISGNWSAVIAFPNLMFTNALGFAAMPGSNQLFVWDREGRVWSFVNDSNVTTKTLVLDISNQCQGWDDSGLLNLAFHPGYATNHYIFVYYTWVAPGTVVGSPTVRPPTFNTGAYHDKVSRFTLDSSGIAIPSSETVFVDQIGNSVWHNGSGMFFHPSNGFLYVTDGDDEDGSNTQVITNNLFSGVWRIDVDRRGGSISHPIVRQPNNGTTANYYIPNDNPFVGQSNALEEFYAIGLRSPHRMTCDPVSGRIFLADVGEGSREELDVIEPTDRAGLNFQWNIIEGLQGDLTPPYIGINKRPILDYTHSEGQAIIGGYVYHGSLFASDLAGKYIFGDNVQKKVWVLDESTSPVGKILLCVMPTGPGPNSGADYTGLSSFGLDQNNEIYFCQMSSVGGHIYTLARSGPPPASKPFPPLLSQTGAFRDVTTLALDTNLIPYNVNSPLWSDGAVKTRWMGLPTNTFVHFTPTGEWSFPNGTVFVKHFELPIDDTNPNLLKRLETRLLVRDTNGTVYGITYKWRTNYTDADLVTNALTEDIVINTGSGTRTQQWFYPGPLDCLRCHTPAASYVLGVKTRQLNGSIAYADTGVTDNQLRAWNHIGLFDSNLNETTISNYDKLVSVTNASASLTYRVRSYLDSNCSQCHRPGGAPALWDARYDTPLANQGIINGALGDNLGLPDAHVITPQSLSNSVMYLRINTTNNIKMPPLARNRIDANAANTLAAWINTMVPPFISPIPDITVNSNSSTGPINFTIGDATIPVNSLVLTASSSNPTLVPNSNIVFGGSGSNRTVNVTVAAGQGGTATITINVDNGQAVSSDSFDVTVIGTLVAWYKFENDALDSSGLNNHGTTNGTVSFVAGKVGAKAINTDGATGSVQIPASISTDFTIALWIKTTATGGGNQWWAGKGIVDGEVGGSLDDFGAALVGNKFGLGIGNPDMTIVSTAAINDGLWHHVAATRRAADGQIKIFVDGVLQTTAIGPTAPRTAAPSLRIGSIQTGSAGGFLAGTFDDVRLYNYVLNATQIGQFVNSPPMLAPISNRTILAGRTLSITNSATDPDSPPQVLMFTLLTPPFGAAINPSNGIFSWRPAISQFGTNLLNVVVSDNGTPSLSATQGFSVTVNRPVQPALANPSVSGGKFGITISGDTGPDYTIQASSNLVNWSPVLTTNPLSTPFQFFDSATNYPQRFYRVILGP